MTIDALKESFRTMKSECVKGVAKQKNPLISCICVTENRPDMLKKAIEFFEAQSYTPKQLVVVYQSMDTATSALLQKRGGAIKKIEADSSSRKTLGELRNIAVRESDGDFICVWDDDDFHHVDRITYQYRELKKNGRRGSILRSILVLNAITNELCVSQLRNWECSLLCAKELFAERDYDPIDKGEDSPLVRYFHGRGYLAEISDKAELYIYVYHGKNTWNLEHFTAFFEKGKKMDLDVNMRGQIIDLPPLQLATLTSGLVGRLT